MPELGARAAERPNTLLQDMCSRLRQKRRSLATISSVSRARIELATRGFSGRPYDAPADPDQGNPDGCDARADVNEHGCPPRSAGVGSSPDVVEQALADAIGKAATAGAWGAVEALTAELRARREARAGVLFLDAERDRRKRGEHGS
jgi:hypothetical protein